MVKLHVVAQGGENLFLHLLAGPVEARWWERAGWFRVGGYGLSVKDARWRELLFSDRNLTGAAARVGPWIVKLLTPEASR